MGCDIHSLAEYRYSESFSKKYPQFKNNWKPVEEALWEAPYFRKEEGVFYGNEPYDASPFNARYYDLFAALADVRNGSDIPVIMQPRGVPEDASKAWRKQVKSWDVDMHSHSWFTVPEIEAAIPTYEAAEIKYTGWVDVKEYLAHREYGKEYSGWSGGVAGARVVHATAAQYNAGLFPNATHIFDTWGERTTDIAETLRAAIAPLRSPRDLYDFRIVFGFDN